MAVEFSCENCGEIITVDAPQGKKVKCPACGKKVFVPEGLASLPQPHIDRDESGAPQRESGPPQEGEAVQEEEFEEEPSVVIDVMAKALPVVMSLFLHAGLFLIMVFVVMIVYQSGTGEEKIFPDARWSENPGGNVNPGQSDPSLKASQPTPTDRREYSREESNISSDTGMTDKRIDVIGLRDGGARGGGKAPLGLTSGGSGDGPRSDFFGSWGNAHHIVYVVDHSGSMADVFDMVRRELVLSVGNLIDRQDFHVIFFADGPPEEMPTARLVLADDQNKERAALFADRVLAASVKRGTNPVQALKRAYAVLSSADRKRPGKLIYFLTDGDFVDNDAVLELIPNLNKQHNVLINTYLYGHRPPEAEKLMKQIAAETGGKYKYITRQ